MSLAATSYVIRRPFGGQIKKLIMLVIADFSGDDTGTAWASIDTLAHRAECSRRSVQTHLEELEAAGEIMIYRNGGPEGTHRFRILFKKSEDVNFAESGGAAFAPPCKRRTVKQHEGGANDGPPDAPKTGKTGNKREKLSPLPPHEGGSEGGDAALIARVKSLRPKWGTGPHLDHREMRRFTQNRTGWQAWTDEDWTIAAEFMRASLPDGTAYTQPRSISLALGMPTTLRADARDWKGKQRPKLEVVKPPPLSDEPPATLEDMAEIFQNPKRMNS